MSDKNQQPGVQSIGPSEAKTPLERASQIQELQRQQEALDTQAPSAPAEVHQAQPAAQIARPQAVFELQAPAQLPKSTPNPVEQAAYAGAQKGVHELFGAKGADIEVTGNVWKTISFNDIVPGLLDLTKPLAEYDVKVPEKAVKLKEGQLFTFSATPKSGGEPKKLAALVDARGELKGAEFKDTTALQRALEKIPSFALPMFASLFGESAKTAEPRHLRIANVSTRKASAYEVVLERRNELTGIWAKGSLTLNNFGLKVPPSPSEPRRHDLVVANYFLDRFSAAV